MFTNGDIFNSIKNDNILNFNTSEKSMKVYRKKANSRPLSSVATIRNPLFNKKSININD